MKFRLIDPTKNQKEMIIMNLCDYQKSKEIVAEEPSFAPLIMAAAWEANTLNFGRLKVAFPEIIEKLEKIYFTGDRLQ